MTRKEQIDPRRESPHWIVVLEAAALYAGIIILRLAIGDNPNEPVLMLHILPLALLASTFGLGGAFVGAIVASGSFVGWAEVRGVDMTVGAYASRTTVFFVLGLSFAVYVERTRRRDEMRYQAETQVLELLDSGYEAFISMDARGVITGWNKEAEKIFGWSAAEALGRTVAETIVPAEQRKAHSAAVAAHDQAHHGAVLDRRVEFGALHKDGHTFPVELKVSAVHGPDGVNFHAFLHDISSRKHAEEELRRRAEDMETIAAATRDLARSDNAADARVAICRAAARIAGAPMTMLFEPGTGATSLKVTAAHGAPPWEGAKSPFGARTGSSIAFATGEPLFVADVGGDPRAIQGDLVAAGSRSAYWYPITQKELGIGVLGIGWTETIDEVPANVANAMSLLAAEAAVAIERALTLERLERIARTDELTGLPNRRAWEEALPRELALAARTDRPMSVAMLDLDHFKRFNDRFGHQAGDRLLKHAASSWRGTLRATDIIARYGGEEFAVLLPACDLDEAAQLVDRLRAATPDGESCSAGVAEWSRNETATEMLARADVALYKAKDAGRDTTVVSMTPAGE